EPEGTPDGDGARDVERVPVGPAGASDALVQPVAASRSSTSGAVGTVRRRRSIITRPPGRGT
ncbi:hypothetical protein R6L23_28310, partial [Streptomyces sp. SR27]|nr:hypothetical protein [Streptomyces sp. SR27]